MKIVVGKTKAVKFSTSEWHELFGVRMTGKKLEEFREFTYLGSNVSVNGEMEEMSHRLSEEAGKMEAFSLRGTKRSLSIGVKIGMLVGTVVQSVLFGSETRIHNTRRVEIFDWKCLSESSEPN